MRKAFISTLVKLAEKDERIYLLTADMGFGLVEPFAEKYPDRFINIGVAEQNMIGVASGLALSGKVVFVYSIGNFPTMNCLDQIRNDVCHHNLNVNIVAGNTGLTYGALGSSHHATEDIAVMRALLNMTVVVPCDKTEAKIATKAVAELSSPCYLRLGRTELFVTYLEEFKIGEAITIMEGCDIILIATGYMVDMAIQAALKFREELIGVRVINMHTIKPIDTEAILEALDSSSEIITIEEHSVIGGLGGAVAEVLAESGARTRLKRMGVPDTFRTQVGTHDELLKDCHLTVDDIVREVRDALR